MSISVYILLFYELIFPSFSTNNIFSKSFENKKKAEL